MRLIRIADVVKIISFNKIKNCEQIKVKSLKDF